MRRKVLSSSGKTKPDGDRRPNNGRNAIANGWPRKNNGKPQPGRPPEDKSQNGHKRQPQCNQMPRRKAPLLLRFVMPNPL
jgi:hypothetical protein